LETEDIVSPEKQQVENEVQCHATLYSNQTIAKGNYASPEKDIVEKEVKYHTTALLNCNSLLVSITLMKTHTTVLLLP